MRDRLVALLVGATIAVITLYGVPRAYFLAELVEDQHQHEVQRAVDTVAAAVGVQQENEVPVTESFLAQALDESERLVHVGPDGTTTSAGDDLPADDADVVARASVEGGGTLTLTRSGEVVQDAVAEALMPLVLLGLALLGASAVGAVLLARRLSRPFQELAGAAAQLGQGRFELDVPHYSVPEAEAIAQALRRSAAQLDVLVRREREFAVNASHELLTPITGLNLQLEDLRMWPGVTPEMAEEIEAALATLERLSSTIHELLAQDRDTRQTGALDVDLLALTRHAVDEWRRTAGEQRGVTVGSGAAVRAHLVPEDFTQLLGMLLDGASRDGVDAIVVDCAELDTHLRVRVGDAGQAAADHGAETHRRLQGALPGGAGEAGVEDAAALAEAMGGYLVRDESGTGRFLLVLPKPSPSAG